MKKSIVKELDYSTSELRKVACHPEIDAKHKFIALINGQYFIGRMDRVWFGWNFNDGWGTCGHQYDPPDTNGCCWQKVWKIIDAAGLRNPEAILFASGLDPVQIAKNDELRYANARRRYCIDYGVYSNKRQITEESPVEAYLYNPRLPKMPKNPWDDEDE